MMTSGDEAIEVDFQHETPCHDCPWRRDSIKGWLGSMTPREWTDHAHGRSLVDCHTSIGAQCAGIAIYRSNVCKLPDKPSIKLPKDHETVFSNRMEFEDHHKY